jgi:hypothetical protein
MGSSLRAWLVVVVVVAAVGCRQRADPAPPDLLPAERTSAELACAGMQACVESCAATSAAACARGCAARLSATARPYYDALQACVAPACANVDAGATACLQPAALSCKLCVMSHCAQLAAHCVAH